MLGAPRSSACTATDVDALGWLAGRWTGGDAETATEEFWAAPREGRILGFYREDEKGIGRYVFPLLAD